MEKISAIFYILCTLAYFWQLLRLKKSDKGQSMVVWGTINIIFIMAGQALVSVIYDRTGIPINLVSLGIAHGLFALGLFVFSFKKEKQKYDGTMIMDWVVLIVNTALILYLTKVYYGFGLAMKIASVDGAMHYNFAKEILETATLTTNKYYEAIGNSVLFMIGRTVKDSSVLYLKIFMGSQMFNLWLSAMSFYALIRRHVKTNMEAVLAECVLIFYLMVYPLYAVTFGFAYYAQVINVIGIIIAIVNMLINDEIKIGITAFYMNALLYALFVCYDLFVPPVFLATFISMSVYYLLIKKIKFLVYCRNMLLIYLLPTVLGMIVSFADTAHLGAGGGITNDGGCYFDLYSNFLRIIPFVFIGIFMVIKNKTREATMELGVMSVLVWILLLAMNHYHRASLYYVSKAYNLMWLCCLVMVLVAIITMWREYKIVIAAIAVSVLSIAAMRFSSFETKVKDANVEVAYIYDVVYENTDAFLPHLYRFNLQWIPMVPRVNDAQADFYEKIRTDFDSMIDDNAIMIGNEYDTRWYEAITGEHHITMGAQDEYEEMLDSNIDYIVGVYSGQWNEFVERNPDLGEVVYQCDAGVIIKLNK